MVDLDDFIFSAWGKTIWGSAEDKASLTTDLNLVRGNFTDIPLIIGEWEAPTTNCEAGARRRYSDYFVRAANAINATIMWWDNGLDQLDRSTGKWRDPSVLSIIMNAVNSTLNALPDGTTDVNAAAQSSSAYIFHRVGDDVIDTTLQFLLNGNTLKSIATADGQMLSSTKDYVASSSGAVTFKAGFLSKYLSASAAPGTKGSLTLTFSAGASLQVDIVQWDQPVLGSTSSKTVASSADIHVPITWKGLNKVAAVKAIANDGTVRILMPLGLLI
jgi:endoglucanase